MNKAPNFGVQSWALRTYKDNATVAQKVVELGLNKLELCAAHADFNKPETFKEVVATYKDAGVSIVSIGVQTFTGNDTEKNWFEFVKTAGAKHISAHFKIDSYMTAIPKVRKWAQEYGVKVGIHCHGGYMFGGQPDVLRYLIDLGSPEIGLVIDTAWCIQIGPRLGQPVEWVKEYGNKLFGIHFKDFTFAPNGQWKDVIVGEGNLDLPAFNKALKDIDYKGWSVIEYEGDVENPIPALKRCIESMLAKAV